MKKVVLAVIMVTLVAGTMFAQGMSFGAGLKGDYSTYKISSGGYSISNNQSRFGANVFFDLNYIEINADLLFGKDVFWEFDTTDLVLGVVGKYPITINDKFVLFPYAGIDYNINLVAKWGGVEYTGSDKADYFNRLAFIFGAGADFHLNDSMFLRAELGFGFLFPNKGDKDIIDAGLDVVHTKLPYKVCIGWKL